MKCTFTISQELKFKLNQLYSCTSSIIAKDLLQLRDCEIPDLTFTLFDLSSNLDEVTYTPVTKFYSVKQHPNYNSALMWKYNRGSMKIGRLVKKIFKDKFTDKQIEDFVNLFKGFKDTSALKLVSGKAIKDWYHYPKYKNGGGQLGNSCMRYDSCQNFFDIYTENADKVQMLIYEREGMLSGRALVWKLDDGRTFMDRIYTNEDSDIVLFKMWAKEHDCVMRDEVLGNRVLPIKIEVTIKNLKYDRFPYMDTLYYFNSKTGLLTNSPRQNVPFNDYIQLLNTTGAFATINQDQYKWDNYHYCWIKSEYAFYCKKDKGYCHKDRVIRLHYNNVDDYRFPNADSITKVGSNYYYKEDLVFSNLMDSFILKTQAVDIIIDNAETIGLVSKSKSTFYGNYVNDKLYAKDLLFIDNNNKLNLKNKAIIGYLYKSKYYTIIDHKMPDCLEEITPEILFTCQLNKKYFTELDYVYQLYFDTTSIISEEAISKIENIEHKKILNQLVDKTFLEQNPYYFVKFKRSNFEGSLEEAILSIEKAVFFDIYPSICLKVSRELDNILLSADIDKDIITYISDEISKTLNKTLLNKLKTLSNFVGLGENIGTWIITELNSNETLKYSIGSLIGRNRQAYQNDELIRNVLRMYETKIKEINLSKTYRDALLNNPNYQVLQQEIKSLETPKHSNFLENSKLVNLNYPFKTGDAYIANIEGTECVGHIKIENGQTFFCQNYKRGSDCIDKLGYNYSWILDDKVENIRIYDPYPYLCF